MPFFFKQWGEWAACEIEVLTEPPGRVIYPLDKSLQLREGRAYTVAKCDGLEFFKAGKKLAGHLLGGAVYHQYPVAAAVPAKAKETLSMTVINPVAPSPFHLADLA